MSKFKSVLRMILMLVFSMIIFNISGNTTTMFNNQDYAGDFKLTDPGR